MSVLSLVRCYCFGLVGQMCTLWGARHHHVVVLLPGEPSGLWRRGSIPLLDVSDDCPCYSSAVESFGLGAMLQALCIYASYVSMISPKLHLFARVFMCSSNVAGVVCSLL